MEEHIVAVSLRRHDHPMVVQVRGLIGEIVAKGDPHGVAEPCSKKRRKHAAVVDDVQGKRNRRVGRGRRSADRGPEDAVFAANFRRLYQRLLRLCGRPISPQQRGAWRKNCCAGTENIRRGRGWPARPIAIRNDRRWWLTGGELRPCSGRASRSGQILVNIRTHRLVSFHLQPYTIAHQCRRAYRFARKTMDDVPKRLVRNCRHCQRLAAMSIGTTAHRPKHRGNCGPRLNDSLRPRAAFRRRSSRRRSCSRE